MNLKLEIDTKRRAILDQSGHLLVCGGPGSGKTTIALLKAKVRCRSLLPGQNVLFLSFSRAAVRQILQRCKTVLTTQERQLIEVKTYHAFCLEILRSHGKLIGGHRCRVVLPADELVAKAIFKGNWNVECRRRALEEGAFCFDMFAPGVSTLFEKSKAVRCLYGGRYPMVVIDEFQDTDNDQWRIVLELSRVCEIFCLADPDQRIFEYRGNIDPKRVENLKKVVQVTTFDLGSDNHRSADAGILDFANAVLYNREPIPQSKDVKIATYYPKNFAATAHAGVVFTFSQLRKRGIPRPCVAVLARSNSLISNLSQILGESHTYNNQTLKPVEHEVAWDENLAIASAAIVGSLMEWPTLSQGVALVATLESILQYFKLKNAERATKSAVQSVSRFGAARDAILSGRQPRIKAVHQLLDVHRSGIQITGDPVQDWKRARAVLEEIEDLNEIYRDARMVRLLGARDALATMLSSLWLSSGSYRGAAKTVKRTLDQERLIASEREPRGCTLMNMHKSKGKEFDGVVLIEGAFSSRFFDTEREKFPFEQSRRLFRVGVTRARSFVTIIRPAKAFPLVGGP